MIRLGIFNATAAIVQDSQGHGILMDADLVPCLVEEYSSGSLCELTKQPRTTKVFYQCQPLGARGILSVSEVRTCEYEVFVNAFQVCQHPVFSPKKKRKTKVDRGKKVDTRATHCIEKDLWDALV